MVRRLNLPVCRSIQVKLVVHWGLADFGQPVIDIVCPERLKACSFPAVSAYLYQVMATSHPCTSGCVPSSLHRPRSDRGAQGSHLNALEPG